MLPGFPTDGKLRPAFATSLNRTALVRILRSTRNFPQTAQFFHRERGKQNSCNTRATKAQRLARRYRHHAHDGSLHWRCCLSSVRSVHLPDANHTKRRARPVCRSLSLASPPELAGSGFRMSRDGLADLSIRSSITPCKAREDRLSNPNARADID